MKLETRSTRMTYCIEMGSFKQTSIKSWITRYFVAVLLSATLFYALSSLNVNRSVVIEHGEDAAQICAKNIQSLLNHQFGFEELKESTESDSYLEARKVLRQICQLYQLEYVF